MELEEIKYQWQKAGTAEKTLQQLNAMTRISNNPVMKKLLIKLSIETLMLLIFAAIYYDWFDGDQKPFYANVALITVLILYIIMDVIGILFLLNPVNGKDIKTSIHEYMTGARRLYMCSMITSVLFTISMLLFFSSVITFNREKSFILIFLLILLVQMMWWSLRIWKKRIKFLAGQLTYFDEVS